MNYEGLMDAYPQGLYAEKPPNQSTYEETFSFYKQNTPSSLAQLQHFVVLTIVNLILVEELCLARDIAQRAIKICHKLQDHLSVFERNLLRLHSVATERLFSQFKSDGPVSEVDIKK